MTLDLDALAALLAAMVERMRQEREDFRLKATEFEREVERLRAALRVAR